MSLVSLVYDRQLVGSVEGQGCGLELVWGCVFTSGGLQGYVWKVRAPVGKTGASDKYQQVKIWGTLLHGWQIPGCPMEVLVIWKKGGSRSILKAIMLERLTEERMWREVRGTLATAGMG